MATAPAHPDAKAQPCVLCCTTGELSALSLASASGASLLLVRPVAGPNFLTPFKCCLQCSLERVQPEHDARPPFLALDFHAGFAHAVHGRANNCTGALFNTLFSQTSTWNADADMECTRSTCTLCTMSVLSPRRRACQCDARQVAK